MKLLYPFFNVMGIFFPVGILSEGGTCQFATETCLKKCCANKPGEGQKIGFEKKFETYSNFLKYSPNKIVKQILSELKDADCKILSWFASGDCPSFLTKKFYDIICGLDKNGIIQTGFTRNKDLWNWCKNINNENCRVLLTVENSNNIASIGLYSVPNYDLGCFDIYVMDSKKKTYHRTNGCGGGYYTEHIYESKIDRSHLLGDCTHCYENNIGCFIKLTPK